MGLRSPTFDNPDAIRSVVMREVSILLPHFVIGIVLTPLVGARISDVIEMIINSGAPTALYVRQRLAACGDCPNLSSHQSKVTSSGTLMPFS